MDAAERKRENERDENAKPKRRSRRDQKNLAEYSSFAPLAARAEALRAFAAGDARVLIASDAATRGLDVDRVGAVISYDAPTHLKTYVHRVGRTAGLPGPARRVHAVSPRRGGAVLAMMSGGDLRKPRAARAAGAGGRGNGRAQSGLQGRAGRREAALEADAKSVAAEEGEPRYRRAPLPP